MAGPQNSFPLTFDRRSGAKDQPPTSDSFTIYSGRGYWARLGGQTFELPADDPNNAIIVKNVTAMLNAAYAQGRSDLQEEIRDLLGTQGVE